MKIPVIQGVIDRRILINYQIDKDVLESFLPHPFKPKLVKGKGVAGICLIRLKEMPPKKHRYFLRKRSPPNCSRMGVRRNH